MHSLVKLGTECNGNVESSLGTFDTVGECADKCLETCGCEYFVYGHADTAKAGMCSWEKVSSDDCSPEGSYTLGQWDLYKLGKFRPAHPFVPLLYGVPSGRTRIWFRTHPFVHTVQPPLEIP